MKEDVCHHCGLGDEPCLWDTKASSGDNVATNRQDGGAPGAPTSKAGWYCWSFNHLFISWPVPLCTVEILPSTASLPNDLGKGGETEQEGKESNHKKQGGWTYFCQHWQKQRSISFELHCVKKCWAGIPIPTRFAVEIITVRVGRKFDTVLSNSSIWQTGKLRRRGLNDLK